MMTQLPWMKVITMLNWIWTAVAAQLPEDGRIWSEAREALGGADRARITVCQGKSCNRAGGLELLKVMQQLQITWITSLALLLI